MDDYRLTYSWQGAVAFSAPLMRLCEELPTIEQFGLVAQIQEMAIELPASIACDIVTGSETRFVSLMRIEAALAVIDRIYPALDASSLMDYIDSLRTQLSANRLRETSRPERKHPIEDFDDSDDERPRRIEIEASDDV